MGGDSSVLRPDHPLPRSLSALAEHFGIEVVGDAEGVEITGVTINSRDVEPGDLFAALPGARRHGAEFAEAARDRGAVALLTDHAGARLAAAAGLPILLVDSPREALGAVAGWIHRTDEHPTLLFGVTGTNGKTSVCYLLYGILGQLGLVAGLSTTAERRIGDVAVTSSLTTPEASELHGLLARMRESEVRAVAIEVSAQALTQHRIDGLVFDVVSFLNLGHDHLDDYADMEQYFAAKLPLFDPDRARRGVVSLDSEWGERLVETARIPVVTVAAEHGAVADWRVSVEAETAAYTAFVLSGPDGRSLRTRVPVLGRHMAANAGLAIVMLVEAGFDLDAIDHVLQRDGGIQAYLPGRIERVSGEGGPAVYVDYGHTPDAFRTTLDSLRPVTEGRIFMVFGADGDRDPSKRHEMGRIASEYADVVVITDYNPRTEDPAPIRAALLEGARSAAHPAELEEVPSPVQAIRTAVARAKEGDAVLWAGPGHEDVFEVGGQKLPFDARAEARLALREAGW